MRQSRVRHRDRVAPGGIVNWPAFFFLLLVGLVYLVVVWLTYSWMIASPRQWLLKSQIERLVTLIEVAERVDRAIDREVSWTVKESLADVQTELLTNRGNFFQRAFKAVHLNELMAVQQTVNGLRAARLLGTCARSRVLRGTGVRQACEDRERDSRCAPGRFDARDATTNGRRMLVVLADELCHAREDAAAAPNSTASAPRFGSRWSGCGASSPSGAFSDISR